MTTPNGWAIWITGLPASGKTTLARALQARLRAGGVAALVLDSDELRPVLAPAAGYGPADRDGFYAQLAALAALLCREGANVLIAATAQRRAYRDAARSAIPIFAEVWAQCPLDVCRARDPKGLYARAAAGALRDLPGPQAAYEPPPAAEVCVDTSREPAAQAAARIIAALAFLRGDEPAHRQG